MLCSEAETVGIQEEEIGHLKQTFRNLIAALNQPCWELCGQGQVQFMVSQIED